MTQGRVRRQANVKGGRSIEHRVLVTPEQESLLQERADDRGVTISKLLVDVTLGAPVVRERAVLLELSGVRRKLTEVHHCIAKEAANVNTATHAVNSGDWNREEWDELRKGIQWRNERLTELFGRWAQ